MIQFQQVGFSYPGGRVILEDISFQMERGECVCLLGPNGTGKTTLLKCLLNHLRPRQGQIMLDGRPVRQMSARERAARIAYVAQATQLIFPYSVEEVILMGRVAHMRLGASVSRKDRAVAWEVMERLGIRELAGNHFQNLSGGERQMVLFGRALAQQADYLVLDEPTAALDYGNQIRILGTIRTLASQGYGILMTTHSPDHAFLVCSRAILMCGGRIQEDGPPESAVTSGSLTKLYHTPVCVTDAVLENMETDSAQRVCIPILNSKGER